MSWVNWHPAEGAVEGRYNTVCYAAVNAFPHSKTEQVKIQAVSYGPPDNRTYHFLAEDEAECVVWVSEMVKSLLH